MEWHYDDVPPFAWDGDVWVRGEDGKRFMAVHEIEKWVSTGEKVPYNDKTRMMGNAKTTKKTL